MRTYFISKDEAIETYKIRINNMLAYLRKNKNMSISDLNNEMNRIDNKISHAEKQKNRTIGFIFLSNRFQNKIDKLGNIYNAIYTAIEICNLYNVDNTAKLPNDLQSESALSNIVDLACANEKIYNKNVDTKKSGYKSFIFSKINQNKNENDQQL